MAKCRSVFKMVEFFLVSFLNHAFSSTAFMNCIPLATTVIDVGNNLHLIIPECTFPVAASSSPVTSVLTPIGRVQTSTVTIKQPYHPAALNPLQRCRTTAPILIPAMARKPSVSPAFAATHSSPAASTAAPSAVHVPAKVRRKKKNFCWGQFNRFETYTCSVSQFIR